MSNSVVKPISIILRSTGLLLASALALNLAVSAADQPPPAKKERPQLAEKTGVELQKLGPLQASTPPNYQGMLDVVNAAIPGVPPDSYDFVFLSNIKAKLLLSMDKYSEAIPIWEQTIKLSDQHDYLDPREINDICLYLAQIIFAEASGSKDLAVQQRGVVRASAYLKRHLQNSPKPTIETQMFYAQMLYQQAVVNPNQVDQALLKQSREVIENSMLSQIEPREGFYMLLLAILQQENDITRSAELLELIVKKYPEKKDYWPLLTSMYLNLASSESEEHARRQHYVRAINAMERAKKLGLMATPKDNYNLVTVYLTAGQYGTATDLLAAGLKAGTIESTLANWRLLGSYYQQVNKELEAIEALKQATKLFPTEGMLDLQIGEIYRQLEDIPKSRDFYRSALDKGNLEKPYVVYQLLAYTAMELDDWPEAHRAITEASKSPEFANDRQMIGLKQHIEMNLAERLEAEKEKEAKKAGNPAKSI